MDSPPSSSCSWEELRNRRVSSNSKLRIMEIYDQIHANRFDAQIKDHSNATLEEQLKEKEHEIYELERRMDEKEVELHAITREKEEVWANVDILQEKSEGRMDYERHRELLRERDEHKAETEQLNKQIDDLRKYNKEKESQIIVFQEQLRIAQETIIFKEGRIVEAIAWMTRAEEVYALQSATNQLQLVCQRQSGELERLHSHLQQLRLEIREKSGSLSHG